MITDIMAVVFTNTFELLLNSLIMIKFIIQAVELFRFLVKCPTSKSCFCFSV